MCLKVEVNSALSALCNVYGFIIFEITSDLNLEYDLKISFFVNSPNLLHVTASVFNIIYLNIYNFR